MPSKYTFHQVSWTGSPAGNFGISDVFTNGVVFGEIGQRGFATYGIETTSGGNATFGTTDSFTTVTGPDLNGTQWSVLPEMMNQQGERVGYAFQSAASGLGDTNALYVNGTILPDDNAQATAISDTGYVTGDDMGTPGDGFLYTPSGSFLQFAVPGASHVYGSGVSDNATVVGQFMPAAGGPNESFERLATGDLFEFTPLAPKAPNGTSPTSATVSAVNSSDWIVGSFWDGLASHGFLINSAGQEYELDVPGSLSTNINAINDSGEIGGTYTTAAGSFAFTADVGGANLGGTMIGDVMAHPIGKIAFHTS